MWRGAHAGSSRELENKANAAAAVSSNNLRAITEGQGCMAPYIPRYLHRAAYAVLSLEK